MSASPPIVDIDQRRIVKCQEATHAPQQITFLLDDLVRSGEQGRLNGEAQSGSRLDVDHGLEPIRGLNRKFAYLGSSQDSIDIRSGTAILTRRVVAIGDESASAGIEAIGINCRQTVTF